MRKVILILISVIFMLSGCSRAKNDMEKNTGETPTGYDGPIHSEYIFVKGQLYICAYTVIHTDKIQEEIVKLGEVIKQDEYHFPDEEYEATHVPVGTPIYQIGDNIYVSYDGEYYQQYHAATENGMPVEELNSDNKITTEQSDTGETPTGYPDGTLQEEYLFVNGKLYVCAYEAVKEGRLNGEIVKLGEVTKEDDRNYPDEEFEAAHVPVGTAVYSVGDKIYTYGGPDYAGQVYYRLFRECTNIEE